MTRTMILSKLSAVKLKKVRSQMMKEALEKEVVKRGNHAVELLEAEGTGECLVFWYRDTPIAALWLDSLDLRPINAGEYENTPATIRQRKELAVAVSELRQVITL